MAGPHITEEVIIDGLDLFDDDDTPRTGVTDPISATLGVTAYVESHVVEDCKRNFADGTFTDSETFDRYYYERKLLIDLIDGVSAEEEQRIAAEKNVDFKIDWCERNGAHYFPLYMRAYEADPLATRAQIFAALGTEPPAPRDADEPAQPTPMMLGGPMPEQPPSEPPAAGALHPAFAACIEGGGHYWPQGHDPATGAPTCTRCAFNPGWAAIAAPAQETGSDPASPADLPPAERNPLEGVDLEALGFEETITPLAIEDEHGVTRALDDTQVAPGDGQTHEGIEAPADGSEVELKGDEPPKPRRARQQRPSKVQRPGAKQ